jgi:hypothetical protein
MKQKNSAHAKARKGTKQFINSDGTIKIFIPGQEPIGWIPKKKERVVSFRRGKYKPRVKKTS